MTAVVLDRPRHSEIIAQCRAAGARIRLISDGDVAAAIEVAKAGAPVDVLFGIGGTPEGMLWQAVSIIPVSRVQSLEARKSLVPSAKTLDLVHDHLTHLTSRR